MIDKPPWKTPQTILVRFPWLVIAQKHRKCLASTINAQQVFLYLVLESFRVTIHCHACVINFRSKLSLCRSSSPTLSISFILRALSMHCSHDSSLSSFYSYLKFLFEDDRYDWTLYWTHILNFWWQDWNIPIYAEVHWSLFDNWTLMIDFDLWGLLSWKGQNIYILKQRKKAIFSTGPGYTN